MSNRERYRQHCEEEGSIPLFSRDWWLDAVCDDVNWDAVLVEKGGKIIGSMPYCMMRRAGLGFLIQPPLTQTLGPWIRPSQAKYAKALAFQKDIMNSLIEQLPDYVYFKQNWHYGMTNWLPFFWKGFRQTTLYTYVLEDILDKDAVWNGIEARIRTDIRKATNRYGLSVREDLGWQDFIEINRMTFSRQGMKLPYSESIVERVDNACTQRGCRKILIAEDSEGRRHAALYMVWDSNSAYYLMGGSDPQLRNSGGMSLIMWEAIKQASLVSQKFDFEGSVVESIERYFRAFGAQQKPYFVLYRNSSHRIADRLIREIKRIRNRG